ncbi:MAG: hypothetical protein MJZ16_08830 [Bacteroidales bacterium]|nr:hypothetical protein [Bacteroidales bacterium]
MSKELYEHLVQMSVEDIIAELESCQDEKEIIDEDFERPFTSHETALYFQQGGTLTLDELHALMNKKFEEMANDGNNSNAPSDC